MIITYQKNFWNEYLSKDLIQWVYVKVIPFLLFICTLLYAGYASACPAINSNAQSINRIDIIGKMIKFLNPVGMKYL